MEKNSVSFKDVIYFTVLGFGMAVQWGIFTTRVSAMESKVASISSIQADLSVVKDATLDVRARLTRIEDYLLGKSK